MEVDEIVHAFLISQICIYGEVNIKESIIVSLKTTYIVMNCFHLIVCGKWRRKWCECFFGHFRQTLSSNVLKGSAATRTSSFLFYVVNNKKDEFPMSLKCILCGSPCSVNHGKNGLETSAITNHLNDCHHQLHNGMKKRFPKVATSHMVLIWKFCISRNVKRLLRLRWINSSMYKALRRL